MDSLKAIARTFWIGGMWVIGLLVAPVLFAALDKVTAGMVAGRLFSAIAWVGLVCGVFLMVEHIWQQGARGVKEAPFWLLVVWRPSDKQRIVPPKSKKALKAQP